MTQDIADHSQNAKIIVEICQRDITTLDIEAIATIMTPDLDIHGRLNQAIFDAAGADLDTYILETIDTPKVGDTFVTPGFGLPAQKIIFSVVPIWRSDLDIVDKHLVEAVHAILEVGKKQDIREIALPLLACGKHGYPQERGVRLIVQAVSDKIGAPLQRICFVCETSEIVDLYKKRFRL